MLLALFGSDEATLSRYFSIDFHSTEAGWRLVLVPTLAPLNKVFASLTLSGQGQLDQLLIADKQGDSTRIRFTVWRDRALPLTLRSRPALLPTSTMTRQCCAPPGRGEPSCCKLKPPGAGSPGSGCCSARWRWRCSAGNSPTAASTPA